LYDIIVDIIIPMITNRRVGSSNLFRKLTFILTSGFNNDPSSGLKRIEIRTVAYQYVQVITVLFCKEYATGGLVVKVAAKRVNGTGISA